jgi:tetratricopeptide (TPR) repeat protein
VAACIAATYWPFILHEATFYAENFTVPALSLTLLILVRQRGDPALRFLLVGTLMVLAALSRLNLLVPLMLYFATAVAVIWRNRGQHSDADGGLVPRTPRELFYASAPTILLLGILLWWNHRVTGTVMLRDQVALTTYVGSEPDFEGLVPRAGLEWRTMLFEPYAAGYPDQASHQDYWRQRTIETIREDPLAWLWLQARKFIMNVNAFEVSQEIDLSYYRSHSSALELPWPGPWLVIPLGLAGIVLFGLRDRRTVLLTALGLLYFLAMMPSSVAARYRLPLVPILIVFGSALLVDVLARAKARRWKALVKPGLLLTLFALLCLPDYLSMRDRVLVHTEYQIGEKALSQGDQDMAISYFRLSLSRYDDDYNSMFWLAQGRLFGAGDIGETRALLTRLLDAKPTSPDAWWLLGEMHLAEHDSVSAAAAASRALELAPNSDAAQELAARLGLR